MNNVDTIFAKMFETWDMCLPTDTTILRRPGKITQKEWSISYVFGEDYLDYYAEHRMTDPRHVRIHSDGRCESLDAPWDMYAVSGDADESEHQGAKENFYAHNRRVYGELRDKGLVD